MRDAPGNGIEIRQGEKYYIHMSVDPFPVELFEEEEVKVAIEEFVKAFLEELNSPDNEVMVRGAVSKMK